MPIDWRSLIAFTLAGAGGQAGALAAQLQQRKREQEQRAVMKPLADAFTNHIPTVNVSPVGTDPYGGFNYGGNPVPTEQELAPLAAKALGSGYDPSAFLSVAKELQPPPLQRPPTTKISPGETLLQGNRPVFTAPLGPPSDYSLGNTRYSGATNQPLVTNQEVDKAPPSRTRIEGDKEIFEQLNPQTQKWEKVSEGPRWAPNRGDVGAPGITDQGVLRREFNTEAGPFETVSTSTVRALEAARDPSASGDLALIFNFMKILDPGSVVRETEFATAQNAAGVPERIRAQYNSVINGERLSEATRRDFVDRARRLYEGQAGQFESKVMKRYKELASRYGIPAENIIQDYRIDLAPYQSLFGGAAPQAAQSPQAGGLSPEEQQELQALRARFGGR